MTSLLAVELGASTRPVVGTIVILTVLVLITIGHFVRRRVGPTAVSELAGVAIEVHQLSKVFAENHRGIDDVSCRILPGRVVGLVGPNGAGKTTLLGMITGLITPTTGTVYIFGHPVHAGAPVLSRVGIALEQPALVPHLTGIDMLRTTWAVTGRPAEDAHLDSVAALSGLDDALHRKVSGYSMGMRQRLALAQAMLGLPDILVLDEPANGLDPAQVRQLRTIVRDYAASGRTVLLSSHALGEIEKICDEVVVVHRGRIALSTAMNDLSGPSALGISFGGSAAVERAQAALAKRDIAFRRLADDAIEVAITARSPVPTVLRALIDDDCEMLALQSASAFEDAYYTAVANGRSAQ